MRRVLLFATVAAVVLLSGLPANAGIYPTIPALNPALWELYHYGADQFVKDGTSAQNEFAGFAELADKGMYVWADADLWHTEQSNLPSTGAEDLGERSLSVISFSATGAPVDNGYGSLGIYGQGSGHGQGHSSLGLHYGWQKNGSGKGYAFGHNSEHHFSHGSNYNVHTGGGTTPTEPVPEPATLALLLLGLAGLGYYKRHQLGW